MEIKEIGKVSETPQFSLRGVFQKIQYPPRVELATKGGLVYNPAEKWAIENVENYM